MFPGSPDSTDKIVKRGLTGYYDASQLRCWPRTGTTATNLIRNSTGTLINGTGNNNSYGGSWTFDGTDDGIKLGSMDPYIDIYTGFTFSAWIYPYNFFFGTLSVTGCYSPSANNYWDCAIMFVSAGSGNGSYPYWIKTYGQIILDNNSIFRVDQTDSIPYFSPTHITTTFGTGDGKLKLYINAVLNNTTNATSGVKLRYFSWLELAFGLQNGGDYLPYNGSICSMLYYNVPLTDAEILQNYNVTKKRFGL